MGYQCVATIPTKAEILKAYIDFAEVGGEDDSALIKKRCIFFKWIPHRFHPENNFKL